MASKRGQKRKGKAKQPAAKKPQSGAKVLMERWSVEEPFDFGFMDRIAVYEDPKPEQ